MSESIKSLPDSCRNSCEFAIGYANPPPYLDANTYSPCTSGGWLNSHLEICLRCAAQDPNSTNIRSYILAQVYDQLLACGPDSWAAPFLPVTRSGDTIWSVAKKTYVTTVWTPTTISTVVRSLNTYTYTLSRLDGGDVRTTTEVTDGGMGPITKVSLSSIPVATWGTTEGFWVEFAVRPTDGTGSGETTGVALPGFGSEGNGNWKPNVGVIVGGVIAGLVGLMVLLTGAWILLRKRRKGKGQKAEERFDEKLSASEKGDSDCEKPPIVEMDTEREKVEMGTGRVYHELGSSTEAFELDANETEVQERTPATRFGPEEEHFYREAETQRRPDSRESDMSGKSGVVVVTTAEMRSDDEPRIQGGRPGSEPS